MIIFETFHVTITTICPVETYPCQVGCKKGAVVRALASDKYGPGSNPGVDAICG